MTDKEIDMIVDLLFKRLSARFDQKERERIRPKKTKLPAGTVTKGEALDIAPARVFGQTERVQEIKDYARREAASSGHHVSYDEAATAVGKYWRGPTGVQRLERNQAALRNRISRYEREEKSGPIGKQRADRIKKYALANSVSFDAAATAIGL